MGIAKEDIISTCQLLEIKQKFIKTLNSWFDMTSAYIALTEVGKIDLHSKLEGKYIFGYPSSANFDIEPIHKISNKKILKFSCTFPDVVERFALNIVIQLWYDFLGEIFEFIVRDYLLNSNSNFDLKKEKCTIKLDKINDNWQDLIITQAKQDFDFLKGKEKLQKIAKLLKVEIPNDESKKIKQYIIIRNLFVHNHGLIRDIDLTELGTKTLQIVDQRRIKQDFFSGDNIKMSIYELDEVKQTLEKISKLLIT